MTADHTISIGGKFADGPNSEIAEINFSEAGGLDGQIIINADNNVYMTWTTPWTGDVIVDGGTVTPGAYPDTDLGDGAIGLARFHLHKEACIPYDGQSLNANEIPNNRVDLVHYGPVQRSTEGALCVKVERKPNGGSWSVVSSQFEPDNVGTGGRVISIKPKAGYSWQAGSEYKITHNSPQGETVAPYIQCVDVTGQPGAKQYTYHFFTN